MSEFNRITALLDGHVEYEQSVIEDEKNDSLRRLEGEFPIGVIHYASCGGY